MEVNCRFNKSFWWYLLFGRYLIGEIGWEGMRLDVDLFFFIFVVVDFR